MNPRKRALSNASSNPKQKFHQQGYVNPQLAYAPLNRRGVASKETGFVDLASAA